MGGGGCYPCAAGSFGFTEFTLLGSDSLLERAFGTMCPGTVPGNPGQYHAVLAKSLCPSVPLSLFLPRAFRCCMLRVVVVRTLPPLALLHTHFSCHMPRLGQLCKSPTYPPPLSLLAPFDIPFCICLFAFASLFVDLRPFAILLISSHSIASRFAFTFSLCPFARNVKHKESPGPVDDKRKSAKSRVK